MGSPCEKLLDRHFKQQIGEFGPIFMRMACTSDQSIISYWLQIFQAAPQEQKWARNCMMLLLFGHLEEFGYLQIPFTDMRNCGRDLNEILDGYQGLVMQVPTKGEVLAPSLPVKRNHFAFVMENSKKCSALKLKNSSAQTYVSKVPKNVSFGDYDLKSLSSVITGISENMKLPRESFDSHLQPTELKKIYAPNTKGTFPRSSLSSLHDLNDTRTTHRTGSVSTFTTTKGGSRTSLSKLTNKISETDDSKLKSYYYETFKENLPKYCQKDDDFQSNIDKNPESSRNEVKFDDLEKLKAKYESFVKFDRLLLADSKRSNNSNLPDLKKVAARLAHNEETLRLLKRNEMLRRECLKYYTRNGMLRPQFKPLTDERKWAKGLVIGAYRALHRYTRCRGLVRGPGKFEQLHNCKHGWRCYRRLMLASCVPYCRTKYTHSELDSKRQAILMRMSYLLRVKQVYSNIGDLQFDRQELLLFLGGLEWKYLKLANELHFLLFKFVK